MPMLQIEHPSTEVLHAVLASIKETHPQANVTVFTEVDPAYLAPTPAPTGDAALIECIMVRVRHKKTGRHVLRDMLRGCDSMDMCGHEPLFTVRPDIVAWSRILKPILDEKPLERLAISRVDYSKGKDLSTTRYFPTQLGRKVLAQMEAEGLT